MVAAHVGPGWKQMSADEKENLGFHNTKDLVVRAKTCTACHVGGDRAEVNHDLYAAGHPPLQYEYSSFLDRYRPFQHWSAADDRRRNPAYEAEAWTVGQAVTAEAASLLALRADAEKSPGPKSWPEFAEYDCSSCHHGLEQQRFRTAAANGAGDADLVVVRGHGAAAARAAGGRSGERPAAHEMEKRNPDPAKVAAGAKALADFYDDWLNHYPAGRPMDADALRPGWPCLPARRGRRSPAAAGKRPGNCPSRFPPMIDRLRRLNPIRGRRPRCAGWRNYCGRRRPGRRRRPSTERGPLRRCKRSTTN